MKKLSWQYGRFVWWILCCLSLYALVLRMVWHTSYVEPMVIGPIVGFVVVYIDAIKKRQGEMK